MGNLAWHKTALPGQVLAHHLRYVDRRAKRLQKQMNSGKLGKKELERTAYLYDLCVGRIVFLSNALTGVDKVRLAEREFDEWQRVLDDAKAKGIDLRLLKKPGAEDA